MTYSSTHPSSSSRTWLITRAATGLGPALATAVLEAGDTLVATDPRPERLGALAARFGERVRVVGHDPADPAGAADAVRLAQQAFGRVDVVTANAGPADGAPIEETSLERFRAQVETTLLGVVSVTQAALPVFRAQRSGHFLHLAPAGSRAGGTPGLGAYQAATAAVAGFSEVLHHEVSPFGVRVTIVEPGAFRTPVDDEPPWPGQVGADYEPTVGRLVRHRRARAGSEPGDPARAARVLVDLVGMAHPPLRLLLGSDAVRSAERAARARAQEAEVWAEVSRSTDVRRSADAAGADRGLAPVLHLLAPAG